MAPDENTPAAPASRSRSGAPDGTLSVGAVARAEHGGLMAFTARWEDMEEITHDRAGGEQ